MLLLIFCRILDSLVTPEVGSPSVKTIIADRTLSCLLAVDKSLAASRSPWLRLVPVSRNTNTEMRQALTITKRTWSTEKSTPRSNAARHETLPITPAMTLIHPYHYREGHTHTSVQFHVYRVNWHYTKFSVYRLLAGLITSCGSDVFHMTDRMIYTFTCGFHHSLISPRSSAVSKRYDVESVLDKHETLTFTVVKYFFGTVLFFPLKPLSPFFREKKRRSYCPTRAGFIVM